MKGKSLVVQIFTVLIAAIGAYSGLLSPSIAAWLGIVSFTLTLVLSSPFLASGSYPQGWPMVLVITNVVGILLQVLHAIANKGLVSPEIVNYVIIGINLLMTGFVKDYGSGSIVK